MANIQGEFGNIYKRFRSTKYWLLYWLSWLLKIILLTFVGPKRMGFHTSYGDGSEIPEKTLDHVRDRVWNNLVFNRWEQGDVLLIDNFRVSHGRQVRIMYIYYVCVLYVVAALQWPEEDCGVLVPALHQV